MGADLEKINAPYGYGAFIFSIDKSWLLSYRHIVQFRTGEMNHLVGVSGITSSNTSTLTKDSHACLLELKRTRRYGYEPRAGTCRN